MAHSNKMIRRFSTEIPKLKIGLVGSGPAAFYTAKYLLKEFESNISIDMFDKLPTPFGLVRTGVAPDHPEVKSVQNDFNKVACSPNVRFFGNIAVGQDLSVAELRKHYSAVVLAYGAESDRKLGIPGESLEGIHAARVFVNWYNGHPHFHHARFDLSHPDCVVIGQGNVAVDVARILCTPPALLETTDMAHHALQALKQSKVKHVHLVGRRGPVQAAFTIKEIREVTKLEKCATVIDPQEFIIGPNCEAEIQSQRALKRKVDLLQEVLHKPPPNASEVHKHMHLRFFLKPIEFIEDKTRKGHVGEVLFERTKLSGPPNQQIAEGTGEKISIKAQLVLKSVGYKSLALEGVPFDEYKSIVPSKEGRVTTMQGEVIPGLYVSGWIKRGPTGIIGTNIGDAKETVQSIQQDSKDGKLSPTKLDIQESINRLPLKIVNNEGWNKIDLYEQQQGTSKGKPREKVVSLEEILKVAQQWQPK